MSDFNDQLKELLNEFDKSEKKYSADLEFTVTEGTLLIHQTAVQSIRSSGDRSEEGLPWRNQTGETRQSIVKTVEVDGDKVEGSVGSNKEWMPALEFGTSKTFKHPILVPALNANTPLILERLKRRLEA